MGSLDYPNPQKAPHQVYEPAFLLGTIAVGGSVSSQFDLSGWTQFALQIVPSGTLQGGTVLTIQGAQALAGPYYTNYGTTGAVSSTIQCGSTGNQIIGPITAMQPLRFVQFVAGGTQANAVALTLLVK